MTRSRRTTALAGLGAAALLAGCGTAASNAVPTSSVATFPGTAVVSDRTVLLEGEVQVADDCLQIVDDAGTVFVPVFPEDEVEGSGGTTAVFGEDLEIGDDVEFRGGGEVPGEVQVPAGCSPETTELLLVTDADA